MPHPTYVDRIALELELPEGFGVTGEYRTPNENEWFLSPVEPKAIKCKSSDEYTGKRIILQRLPTLPAPKGLTRFKWAAKQKNGRWQLFTNKPIIHNEVWHNGGVCINADEVGWEPPSEATHLPYKRSLFYLSDVCMWHKTPSFWQPSCSTEHTFITVFDYCPACGLRVVCDEG